MRRPVLLRAREQPPERDLPAVHPAHVAGGGRVAGLHEAHPQVQAVPELRVPDREEPGLQPHGVHPVQDGLVLALRPEHLPGGDGARGGPPLQPDQPPGLSRQPVLPGERRVLGARPVDVLPLVARLRPRHDHGLCRLHRRPRRPLRRHGLLLRLLLLLLRPPPAQRARGRGDPGPARRSPALLLPACHDGPLDAPRGGLVPRSHAPPPRHERRLDPAHRRRVLRVGRRHAALGILRRLRVQFHGRPDDHPWGCPVKVGP
mmetsp:Transcript_63964/g.144307  ORF Transcript_63964/g.144307 Transcript_63964/m.144307 type:complete len:260 (+) Transcript_63964:334-1113(+)